MGDDGEDAPVLQMTARCLSPRYSPPPEDHGRLGSGQLGVGLGGPDMFDSSPDPEAGSSPEWTRAIDHRRRFGREVVGVREYEGEMVAVIAVDGSADAPSRRHQRQKVSPATLPVAAVAAVLRQFDQCG